MTHSLAIQWNNPFCDQSFDDSPHIPTNFAVLTEHSLYHKLIVTRSNLAYCDTNFQFFSEMCRKFAILSQIAHGLYLFIIRSESL